MIKLAHGSKENTPRLMANCSGRSKGQKKLPLKPMIKTEKDLDLPVMDY